MRRRIGRFGRAPARRAALLGAVLAMASLSGCAAATLLDIVGQDGNDGSMIDAQRNLSHTWSVRSLTGTQVGSVNVPEGTQLRWDFRSDGTFRVTSLNPIPLDGDNGSLRRYDETGRWRVIDPRARRLGLILTRTDGADVPFDDQREQTATYIEQGPQLVLLTRCLGPGDVRYVAQRLSPDDDSLGGVVDDKPNTPTF